MAREAFGNHPLLRHWDTAIDVQAGQVTFGAAVIPHFLEGIREFLAVPASRTDRNYRSRLALGLVPWLTSMDIAQVLARLDGVCVIVDKKAGERRALRHLAETGQAIQLSRLGMDSVGPRDLDGLPPLIHPGGGMPGEDAFVGPVRVAGYSGDRSSPLLHAKLLVLCGSDHLDYGEDWDGVFLDPVKVWLGSANWTDPATTHLEFGLWSRDPELVRAALAFVRDVIRVSEPLDSRALAPAPDLAEADWDDGAFGEYAADGDDDPEESGR